MNRFITLLSNLNVILALVGYQFITTLFADYMLESSQVVTVPYRAFTLFVAILTIFVSFIKKSSKINGTVILLFIYWGLLSLRFGYDMTFRPDLVLSESRVNQVFLFMVCLSIIPMIGLVRTYQALNLDKILIYCYIMSSISIVLTMINNVAFQEATIHRVDANTALGTIGTGHLGLTNIILGLVLLFRKRLNYFFKACIILIGVLAVLIMLRSGSRGPVLALTLVLAFFLYARSKYNIIGLITVIIVSYCIYVSLDYIMDWLDNISPILKTRLFEREDATSDRDPLYNEALNIFINNPIFGRDFALYTHGNSLIYPHNLFIESLMQLGIIGCIILCYVVVSTFRAGYKLIHSKSKKSWIVLLFVQSFAGLLVSGTFSMDPTFSLLIVLVALSGYSNNEPQKFRYIKL